jgi:hypothetical protein
MSARCFHSFLDDRQLTLIKLEVNDLPRLGFLPREVPFDFVLKSLLWHFLRLVQPGCTIEVFSIPPRYFHELHRLAPSHLSELRLGNQCQIFMVAIR